MYYLFMEKHFLMSLRTGVWVSATLLIFVHTQTCTMSHTHRKEMVLRALSATARACSICVACKWKAMYCSQSSELSGEARSRRSNAVEVSGRADGSISSASKEHKLCSASCCSFSISRRDLFTGLGTREKQQFLIF